MFPIRVTATLVDSILIEAGLAHYARLLEMDKTEEDEFRRTYFDKYDPADYVLVWCELRTSLAESYLDYHRWIIYLEDDSGSQCESDRPLEGSRLVGKSPAAWHDESRPEQEDSRQGNSWQGARRKSWMLRFPRYDISGHPILREGTRSLRLVFLQSDKENTRSEGSWRFVE